MNPEPDRLYSGQGSGLDFFFPILQEVEGFASGHPNGSMLFQGYLYPKMGRVPTLVNCCVGLTGADKTREYAN